MATFKKHIHAMSAYKPPLDGRDPNKHLLLDFNERTLPVSQAVSQAMIDYIQAGKLQMYPAYGDIDAVIADYCGVNAEQVMITNGSDQGIDLIIRASCVAGDEAIIPSPSFAMYHQCAKVENLTILEPQYTLEGGFPLAEVLAAISPKTRIICLANPNNPSGTGISREGIEQILKAAPHATVLVDECYFEYSGLTVCDWVDPYKNLVITRTFSKTWGIPSLRLGFVLSCKDNIQALLNVRGPYDINQLAIVAIRAALANPEYTHDYVREVMREAKPIFEAFLQSQGVSFWPSDANYVWCFPANPDEINRALVAAGILVRPKADGQGQVGLRVTIGTVEQTQRAIAAMKTVMA
ncbi:MAG TPA: histidinol-phosphate transaminase [Marinagarivorans sp.]